MDPDYRERRRRERRESGARDERPEIAERRHRRGHRATDSQGDLLPRAPKGQSRRQSDSEWESPSPRKKRHSQAHAPGQSTPSSGRSRESGPLSLDALAKLDKENVKKAGRGGYDYDEQYLKEVRQKEAKLEKERRKEEREEKRREREALQKQEQKRREYESDAAIEKEAKRRREESQRRAKSKEAQKRASTATDGERSRSRAPATDDEGRKRRSAYTERDRDRRNHTDAERDEREERKRRFEAKYTASEIAEKKERRRREKEQSAEQKKRRVVSGPLAEEGGVADDDDDHQYMMEKRGGAGSVPSDYTEEELARRKKIKRIIIGVVAFLLILAIIIPVAVLVSKNSKKDQGSSVAASTAQHPSNSNLQGHDPNSVPDSDKGTILDPWSWWDTTDFNVTYTNEKIGGLPIIGLNSTWNDDVTANDKVPSLKDSFSYGKMPIRGINVGGWLNIEPFITPSFFSSYSTRDGIVDEWTLTTKLGAAKAKETLEKHYSNFVNRQSFIDIRNAGFDHVRIPFGYWMVDTYPGDPYVPQVSWRYLLRGIEYARQNGLRVNLDLHGAPGSQNGWNHSGRQGAIGWLNGTDGDLNGQRWLDIHHKLSVFFAQPRYKSVVTMYGLVNEPRMVDMNTNQVLNWTQRAIDQVRADNISAVLVFGDGFLGLDNWRGRLQNNKDLLLDVHQYVIFNIDQLSLNHTDKLNFACKAWSQQSTRSMDTATGFGPTMCGEWSQADTDCTTYINNVGTGTRWEGTLDTGNASTAVTTPQCPAKNKSCACASANADPGSYSDAYKKWLYQFAVAQMESFEKGWGWFYWTWETERATQWSWKLGMKAGILPTKVWERGWGCLDGVEGLEDFGKMGLAETY